MSEMNSGKVFLVGAGPGDPDLLTVKARRLIEEAEVVVYDRLVSEAILDLVPKGAARIFVGKESARHSLPQSETNVLLEKLAKARRRVVRLKGGDPFVFGRGGEEATHLARAGIAVEIVPGITAGSGCAAAAGIPLTHRGLATSVRFVTGHCRNDLPLDLNWESLADPDQTLVVYMGLAHIEEISERLIAAGLPRDTPVAAIARGTTHEQRIIEADLEMIAVKVREAPLSAPILFVIGKVVTLRAELAALIGASQPLATPDDFASFGSVRDA